MPLGITMMSAGSCTAPGGYTGQCCESLHFTVRGRAGAAAAIPDGKAEAQFAIDDDRSPEEVAATLTRLGLEPVWKDWDPALTLTHA